MLESLGVFFMYVGLGSLISLVCGSWMLIPLVIALLKNNDKGINRVVNRYGRDTE